MHWSPDGRRLLVLHARDGYDGGHRIGLLNPTTGTIRAVGSVTGGTASTAAWLPTD
jgi:Tol biopolymer transport system component